ncbi:MAG: hypothetical protein MR458_04200, partial [Erysipelotrichaceae bacterium]|nr:hypothetical protein [Erysipelotrichaceae bacterium]
SVQKYQKDYCPGHLSCQTTYIRNNPVTFIFNHRIFYVCRYLLCIAYENPGTEKEKVYILK